MEMRKSTGGFELAKLIVALIVLFITSAGAKAENVNLLTNPGFEDSNGWAGRGCTFTYITEQQHSGSRSGKASGRTEAWQGIKQSLLDKMQDGSTYQISGWVRLENSASATVIVSVEQRDGLGTRYFNIDSNTASNNNWVLLSGSFTLDVNGTLAYLDVYFEGPPADVNFYVDDANVFGPSPIPPIPPIPPEPNATGEVDFGDVHQELEGFGASGAWFDDWLLAIPEPNRNNLYDTLFRDSGFDIYRVRNTYGYDSNYITRTKEIVQAAKTRNPSLKILNSAWTPPAYLKSNNDINSFPQPGTLKKDADGVYMYDEYADWWAASLAAFDSNGIHLDYVSIQNEPDFEATYDSCKFLPSEDSNYAGYNQAFEAVYQELDSRMSLLPKLLAPDSGGIGVSQGYIDALVDTNHVYGYAHHLYMDGDYDYPDTFILGMQSFAQQYGYKPLLQTEYGKLYGNRTDFDAAMNTARHIHNSLVYEGVCSYLYWDLFWGPDSGLVTFPSYGSPSYTINPIYYAFKHYSAFTDPGWYRVGAETDSNSLRITAFKNPDNNELTIVIVNIAETVDINLSLDLGDFTAGSSVVYQTKSDVNWANLGAFSQSQPLLLPKQSITTISLTGSFSPDFSSCDDVLAAGYRLTSDISGDCYVNWEDLKIITDHWLSSNCDWRSNYCDGADFKPLDGDVDFVDFSKFGLQWMWCNNPEDANCIPSW